MVCSKKIIMLILFIFALFFCNFCYASDEQLDTIIDQISQVTENQAVLSENLGNIADLTISQTGVLNDIKSQISEVKGNITNIETYGQWTVQGIEALNKKLVSISTQLDTLAKSVLNIETYSQWTVQNLESINKKLDNISSQIQAKQDEIKNEITSQGTQINNSVNKVDTSINNSDVSADASSLPTDNTSDITADGFNNIFNQLYKTFTTQTAQDLVITIPFTKKSFTINSKTVYAGANLGFVKTLIETFWYFVISYFIVQDIAKKINKIKSGDIENVQQDNIKEDLL